MKKSAKETKGETKKNENDRVLLGLLDPNATDEEIDAFAEEIYKKVQDIMKRKAEEEAAKKNGETPNDE